MEELLDDLADEPIPNGWIKRYFLHTGVHMILSEYGWEPGDVKESYLDEDPEWKPLDEVNAQPR